MLDSTELKTPLAFVVILTLLGCFAGFATGYLLGTFNPGYYHAMFPDVPPQRLDEVAVGIGLGVTQGALLVSFLIAWRDTYQPNPGIIESALRFLFIGVGFVAIQGVFYCVVIQPGISAYLASRSFDQAKPNDLEE
ncbi:hypothetical protein RISK_002841 [Rhodopirellula islandica]|uniref:Uncharacterized protein n=1 Tax=Rhodopirellula islandica TaxID=595434 RepID=A0A0J1EHQ3_RHOIS|nr:hypothetical protein [Rhodopirellula islandica]KLU05079.1 hypothetical protein RISK_002841 [Rhodopirellula islandica]